MGSCVSESARMHQGTGETNLRRGRSSTLWDVECSQEKLKSGVVVYSPSLQCACGHKTPAQAWLDFHK